MTCLEAQSYILSFVEKKLPDDKKLEFVKHIKYCKNCREELEIYYTLIVGMRELDNDNLSLDFKIRLDNELNKIEQKAKNAKRFKLSSFSVIFTGVVFLMFLFYNNCLNKVYNIEQYLKEQKMGNIYFVNYYGDYLYSCEYDLIKEQMDKTTLKQLTLYDRIRIYKSIGNIIDQNEDNTKTFGG